MPTAGDNITPSIRLVRELGAGGMGSVWIADHVSLHTQVVVKFMHAALVADHESLQRFSREAAAGANVKSPHVVQVHDHGVAPDGSPFIVMEHLEGCDLSEHLAKHGTMSLGDIEQVVTQTCKALARAHERGIVHRDIKPQNIFLTNLGGGDIFVKVLDFGIAKSADLQNSVGTTTKTGAMMGTPYYMSPEQIIGSKTLDHRTDLWALGVVAFECLGGKRPFDGETLGGLALTICSGPMPLPSSHYASIPEAVDRWFLKACARDLPERFASAMEMSEGLRAAIANKPIAAATILERVSLEPSPFALTNIQRESQTPAPITAPGFGAATTPSPAPAPTPAPTPAPFGSTTRAPVSDDVISAPPGTKGGSGRIFVGIAAALGLIGVAFFAMNRSTTGVATTAPATTVAAVAPPATETPSAVPLPPATATATPPATAATPVPVETPSASASPEPPAHRSRRAAPSATSAATASASPSKPAKPAATQDPNSIY